MLFQVTVAQTIYRGYNVRKPLIKMHRRFDAFREQLRALSGGNYGVVPVSLAAHGEEEAERQAWQELHDNHYKALKRRAEWLRRQEEARQHQKVRPWG